MTKLNDHWFTEIAGGSAFSMKIKSKLHEETTPYQKVSIYETEQFGNLMLIDDLVMLTSADNFFYHETLAHTPLYLHPNPKDVVIIGGGDCGTLLELSKHTGLNSIHQIEIDEAVTRLSRQYFPELCVANEDPRVTLDFEDGIAWMKHAPANSADIIIVDSYDPIGPAAGLFTVDFYKDCLKTLREGGIIINQSGSPIYEERLYRDIHAAMRSAGLQHTRGALFPQPVYPSGTWSAILGSASNPLTDFRVDDAKNRPFETKYYNEAIHTASMAVPPFLKID